MSDYSSFALFTAGLAVFAAGAKAQVPTGLPGGSSPTGPAIYEPNLNTVVPAGTPYAITWDGAATGCDKTIDLVLLMGPSSADMNPLVYIKQGVTTSDGSYSWTPSKDLAPSDSNYGIELVCTGTKAYQYSTRFGISNADYKPKAYGSYSSSSSTSAGASSTGSSAGYGSSSSSSSSTTSSSKGDKTSSATPKYPVGTATGGSAYGNSTEPKPTGGVTSKTTLTTAATTGATTQAATGTASATKSSATSSQTGAAGQAVAGLGSLVAAVAVAIYAL